MRGGNTRRASQPIVKYSAIEMPLTTLLFMATAFIAMPTSAHSHSTRSTQKPTAVPWSAIMQ